MDWEQLTKDFKQKYEGTYCFVKINEKEPELCLIKEVEYTSQAPSLHIFHEEVGEILLQYDTSYSDIEFRYPEVGLFEFRQQALYIRKLYNRQWTKGPGLQTLAIDTLYRFLGAKNPAFDLALMKAALKPRSIRTVEDGVLKLSQGNFLSIPLSHEFALGLSVHTKPDEYLLWYNNVPIGVVNEKIVLKTEIFRQELCDFLYKSGSHYAISC